mgnify:CR=1 FL=1
MNEEDLVDEEVVVPTATEDVEETVVEETPEETTQDPLETELNKVKNKGRTKAEKLLYTKKRVEEQLKELGIEEDVEDDDQPVTMADLKRFQAQNAQKTALDLASSVTNETERALIEYHLENTIRSTGNPQEDFQLAQGLVNAVKNKQIVEETIRKPLAKTHSSGSGAPAKVARPEEELNAVEKQFLSAPFNLTKEQIIEARPKA